MKRRSVLVIAGASLCLLIFHIPASSMAEEPAPSAPLAASEETGSADSLTQSAYELSDVVDPIEVAPIWVDRKNGQVVAGVTPGTSEEAKAQLDNAGAGTALRIDHVQFTEEDLNEIRDLIVNSVDKLPDFPLGRVGLRPRDNAVAVEVLGDESSLAEMERAIINLGVPPEALIVEQGKAGDRVALATRYADTPPWSSSTHIDRNGSGGCSSGPGVLRDGTEYVLTAAHCYPVGAWIKQR